MEYHPYKIYIYFVPFFALGGIFCLMMLSNSLWKQNISQLFSWVIFGIICIGAVKYCYDSIKVTIFVETEGLRIVNDRNVKYYYIPYEKISYAYYCNSYRGHLYLVLSTEALCKKQIKKLVNKNVFIERVCIDDSIVIYLAKYNKKAELIKEIVSKNLYVEVE